MFVLVLFYYWLVLLASKGHHQANIKKKKIKMLVHIVQKHQFYGMPYAFISSFDVFVLHAPEF